MSPTTRITFTWYIGPSGGDDVLAQAMVAGEHTVIAGHVEAGRRNQGAQAGEELVGVHVGVGGAAAPGALVTAGIGSTWRR